MIDIFSSAYVTSLLFYFMVDYFPAMKQEKIAKDIIMPKLVSLYLYISDFLAMIEYSAKRENIFQTGNIDDMDNLHIQDNIVLCKKKSYKNEIENGTAPHFYSLLKSGDNIRRLILDICTEISCTPSFAYCDTQIIHIISEIQLSELLRIFPNPNDFLYQMGYLNISHMGLGKGYHQLVSNHKDLSHFVDTRLACEMIDISKDEIEGWKQAQAEALKQNPELVKILSNLKTRDQ